MLLDNKKNEKVIFDLNINGQKKILKKDENNKYGKAMIKPFPYGCIKKQKHPPSLTEFNKILTNRSYEGHFGNHFIVDIKFCDKNPKTLLFNEIY